MINKLTNFINNNYIFLVCVLIIGTFYFLISSTFPYWADDIYLLIGYSGVNWHFYGYPRFGLQVILNILHMKNFSSFGLTVIILLNCYLIFFYSFSRNIFNSTTKVKDTIYYVLIFLLYLKFGTWEANLWLDAAYAHTGSVLIILGCFLPFYYLLQGKDVFLKKYWFILLMLLSVYPLGFSSYNSVPLWLIATSCSVLFYIYKYRKIPFIHIIYIIFTLISYYLMMFVFKTHEFGHQPIEWSKINNVYYLIKRIVGIDMLYVYLFIISCTLIYCIYLIIKNKSFKSLLLNNNVILLKSFLIFLLFVFGVVMFVKADYIALRHFVFVFSLYIISIMMIINFIDVSLSDKYRKILLYPAFLILFLLLFVDFYDNYIVRSVAMKSAYENYFVKIQEQAQGLTENDVIYVDSVQPFQNDRVYPIKYREYIWAYNNDTKTLEVYRKYLKIKPQLKMRDQPK